MDLLRREQAPGKDGPTSSEVQQLSDVMSSIGPECEEIFNELTRQTEESGERREQLAARLRVQLEGAEAKKPSTIDALERLLYRPVCFGEVLSQELNDVKAAREARGLRGSFAGEDAKARARNAELCGLALSGGGIRSATFNLGLLQALAKYKVLRHVDYLSMVSGGGYIGGWLAAWIKRSGFDKVEQLLQDERLNPRVEQLTPISFLRDYASYLTPEVGFFSADTWTAGMTWCRNTLLNLLILLSGLSVVLLIPRLLLALQVALNNWLVSLDSHLLEEGMTMAAIACQTFTILRAGKNLGQFNDRKHDDGRANLPAGFGDPAAAIQKLVIVPAIAAAWLGSFRLWSLAVETSQPSTPKDMNFALHGAGIGAMVFGCLILLMFLQRRGRFIECYVREKRRREVNLRMAQFLCVLLPLITACVKGILLFGVFKLFCYWYRISPITLNKLAVAFGTPLLLLLFGLCITIHIGLMGRNFPDDRREWWSRIAAYVGIYAIAILAIFLTALFGRELLDSIHIPNGFKFTAAAGWIATTVGGILAAKRANRSKPASEETQKSTLIVKAFLAISPVVFMAGLFLSLSIGLDALLKWIYGNAPFVAPYLAHHQTLPFNHYAVAVWAAAAGAPKMVFHAILISALLLVLLGITFGLARTVDINEFSMHHFYRNRLIRAYLGASNFATRRPNRLTGFDESDDVLMANLRPGAEPGLKNDKLPYHGPYPIFNAALNLVHGDRLSWQERKATSFVFTPRFCGYDYLSRKGARVEQPLREAGYRPTIAYAYPDGGIHLGTAMAISGAAMSPNAGFHSSTPLAFLLTVFNVRLGWWMGNPRHDEGWQRSGPRFGLMYLLYELFGWTNDRQRHVYLSDGGHFENLGIYELVRRRCSLIIASDAEEDADYAFRGLAGVIRKCFIDCGVRIDIDVQELRPDETGASKKHYVIGRVNYPEGWSGTLLYIKSSLSGDEPADLREYVARGNAFPNQSTADQSFDETQFESYHRLGLHIGKEAFGPSEEPFAEIERIRTGEWTADQERDAPAFFYEEKAREVAAGD